MSIRIGDTAPDFTAATSKGEINFHEWAGNDWVVFFSVQTHRTEFLR